MKYTVTITQTTGKTIEETTFDELQTAMAHFKRTAQYTSYQRVLIILQEKPTPYEEHIIDVHFVDGISYNIPKVGNQGYEEDTSFQ